MTLIFVDGDNTREYERISKNKFKQYTYYMEDGTPSSSMRGEICLITTYKCDGFEMFEKIFGPADSVDFFDKVLEDLDPEIIAREKDHNTGYAPDKFKKLYDEKARAYAKLEAETGFRYY